MSKSTQRNFEALDYSNQEKTRLTAKQYLVYSYLMSVSKWDSHSSEKHYYVYKDTLKIKEVCSLLGITDNTWRNSLRTLKDKYYIIEEREYYLIRLPYNIFAPLEVKLIKLLVSLSKNLKQGGNIVAAYCVLYRYWKEQSRRNETCEITVSQLKNIFTTNAHINIYEEYRTMLALFKLYDLINITPVKKLYKGQEYTGFIINNVKLDVDEDYSFNMNEPDVIQEILKSFE